MTFREISSLPKGLSVWFFNMHTIGLVGDTEGINEMTDLCIHHIPIFIM